MTRRDFSAALYHLDRLCDDRWNLHRAELECILLQAIFELEAEERDEANQRRLETN